MKKNLSKPENWLLLNAGLIILFHLAFAGNTVINIHLHDAYYVISNSYMYLFLLLVAALPFILHRFLDKLKRGNKIFLRAHVFLTILLSIWFYFSVMKKLPNGLAGMPRRYYDYGSFEKKYFLLKIILDYSLPAVLLCLLQLLFVLYSIIVFLKRPNRN